MHKTGTDQDCQHCGKTFYVPAWRAANPDQPVKFCSRECLWAGRDRREKAPPITLKCAQCDIAFDVPPHRAKKAKYCSVKCGVAAEHVEKVIARRLLEEETLRRGFKTCAGCNCTKPVSEFWIRSETGLLRNNCKSCMGEQVKAWVEDNADRKREADAEYYSSNKAHCNERSAAYYLDNKLIMNQQSREWRERNLEKSREIARQRRIEKGEEIRANRREHYRQNKPRYVAQSAMRTERIKQATPPWADFEAIVLIYEEAARLTQETGIVHHVDHDIPLKGKNVSGLHVETNLRILTAAENLSKSNRFQEAA